MCAERNPRGRVITRKPILPSDEEMEENPRSKSAKLRIFEKKFKRRVKMAETGRHTNTVSGKRRPQNVYVDGNTVRKVQEVPERREYRQPEHSVRKKIRQNQS